MAAAAATIGKAQPKLNQAVQQHNQADEQLQSDMSDYKKTCQSTDLNNSQHDRCNRRQKQLNAQIDQINSGTENLQVQQKALQQQIAQYNTESQALNEAIPDNTDAINKTFAAEEEWLDEARNLVAAPAFAPYRKAAGCPNVVNPPTTGKELQKMAGELLNCLQNLAHSTKPKHTAAAKGGTAGGA
ncbi:MAG: hypothetical protein ACRES7_00065 [Gammaproteobacteria bacterium]